MPDSPDPLWEFDVLAAEKDGQPVVGIMAADSAAPDAAALFFDVSPARARELAADLLAAADLAESETARAMLPEKE